MIPIGGNQYLFSGSSASAAGCTKTVSGFGGDDFAVFVLDDNGDKIWENVYGGDAEDQLNSMVKVPGGGFLLAGYSESGVSGNKTAAALGGGDIWVVRIDGNGNKLWDKTYGTGNLEIGTKVIATADGGFLITGLTYGATSTPNYGEGDYLLLKIDASGNQQWMKNYGSSRNDEPHDLIQNGSGDYFVCGNSQGGADGNKTAPALGGYDIWLICVAPDGTKKWDKAYGSAKDDFRGTILKLIDGNYLIPGFDEDVCSIRKIDINGNLLWKQDCAGNDQDFFEVGAQADNGDIYVAGESTTNSAGCKTSPFIGGGIFGDIWLTVFDQDGNKLNDMDFGGNDADLITHINIVNGDVFLTGWSDSHISGNKTTDNCGQSADGWIIRLTRKLYIHDPTPVEICNNVAGYDVDFAAYNVYSPGNMFTVQLSDAYGLFETPIDIGTKASLTSDQIAVTLPVAMPIGTNYRIRVISSLPKDTSSGYPLWLHGAPEVALGSDTSICENKPLLLSAGIQPNGAQILWNDATSQPTLTVSSAGTYWCQVTNTCGVTKSTIVIAANTIPIANAGNDTAFCDSDIITMESTPQPSDVKFLWSTGDQTASIAVSKGGSYWLETSNSCGSTWDTLVAKQLSLPVSMLNKNPYLCDGVPRILDAGSGDASYRWNDGSTGATLSIQTTGIYWVKITNTGGCINVRAGC